MARINRFIIKKNPKDRPNIEKTLEKIKLLKNVKPKKDIFPFQNHLYLKC